RSNVPAAWWSTGSSAPRRGQSSTTGKGWLSMALKREVSLGVGLATAALVWGIYNSALPSIADVRVSQPDDPDAAAVERAATWTAAAAVAGVSLISRDPTVFVLGGSMV